MNYENFVAGKRGAPGFENFVTGMKRGKEGAALPNLQNFMVGKRPHDNMDHEAFVTGKKKAVFGPGGDYEQFVTGKRANEDESDLEELKKRANPQFESFLTGKRPNGGDNFENFVVGKKSDGYENFVTGGKRLADFENFVTGKKRFGNDDFEQFVTGKRAGGADSDAADAATAGQQDAAPDQ